MALAVQSVPQFLGPLQALWSWATQPRGASAPRAEAAMAPQLRSRRAPRVVRVVRMVDFGQPRGGAGRMVISGRMADVCAELDRLAAREAPQR